MLKLVVYHIHCCTVLIVLWLNLTVVSAFHLHQWSVVSFSQHQRERSSWLHYKKQVLNFAKINWDILSELIKRFLLSWRWLTKRGKMGYALIYVFIMYKKGPKKSWGVGESLYYYYLQHNQGRPGLTFPTSIRNNVLYSFCLLLPFLHFPTLQVYFTHLRKTGV